MKHHTLTLPALFAVASAAVAGTQAAYADNKRLNDSVVGNVFTVQHQAGCTNDVKINPQLQLAAQQHAVDLLNNRTLNGDIGSDGSMPQDRANAAGYRGAVAETVATNPAVAISGIELINQWYYNPRISRSCPIARTARSGFGPRTPRIAPSWWPFMDSPRDRRQPDLWVRNQDFRLRLCCKRMCHWIQAPTTTPAMRSNSASTGYRGSCGAYTPARHAATIGMSSSMRRQTDAWHGSVTGTRGGTHVTGIIRAQRCATRLTAIRVAAGVFVGLLALQ